LIVSRERWAKLGFDDCYWPLSGDAGKLVELLLAVDGKYEQARQAKAERWKREGRLHDSGAGRVPEPRDEVVMIRLVIHYLTYGDFVQLVREGLSLADEWYQKDCVASSACERSPNLCAHMREQYDQGIAAVGFDRLVQNEAELHRLYGYGTSVDMGTELSGAFDVASLSVYALRSLSGTMLDGGIQDGFIVALYALFDDALDGHEPWR